MKSNVFPRVVSQHADGSTRSLCRRPFAWVVALVFIAFFPRHAFAVEARAVLEKLQGTIPSVDVTLLEKSLIEGSTRSAKSGYEYVLWDIAKSGSVISLDEDTLVAGAIALACCSPASPSLVKIDVVKILQQDAYGKPRWDTAQRLGHIEVPTDRCEKVMGAQGPLTREEVKAIPAQMKVHL